MAKKSSPIAVPPKVPSMTNAFPPIPKGKPMPTLPKGKSKPSVKKGKC